MIHGDILGERARLSPRKVALVDVATGRRSTYRELDDRAVAAARLLRERVGLRRGERVALLAGNRPEYLEVFFAAGKAGLVVVPLGTRLTPRELAGVLSDAGARTILYSGEHSTTVRALREEVEITSALAFDRPAADGDLHYEPELAALAPSAWRREPSRPEDIYALLYTSGTTGRPKGVMVPHRMVAWNGLDSALSWQLRADDVSPLFTPLYHAGGLGAFLVPIVAVGGTVVLHRGFDPLEVWQTIEHERATVVLGVPTIWKLLLDALETPELAGLDLSSLRWVISGGAPLPAPLLAAYQARGIPFKQGYGLTEVGVNCFAMSVDESRAKAGSIGKPLMFTEARLIDEDGGEVPVGEVGELLLRGPHVCRGYWGDPEATARALDADGWFHTGDLARTDDDGFFYIAGRRKDMVITGGVNVYPAEVENELLLHPDLADVAVVGVPHPTWGETVVAFVVPAASPAPSEDELAAFLADRLARFKIPRSWVVVDDLPRTAYGKVVKGELRQRYLASHPQEESR